MSFQFIIGSSGSGKTHRLYEDLIERSIREPQSSFIAIVPEQFTMQTQKQIVTMHPDHGTMNIDIVSFNRLAYRIFEELAVEHAAVLDDMGKSMVLRKVAAEQRKNLELYGGHLNQTGFINQLKSMLSELYQYGIEPEMLDEAAKEAGSALLEAKCRDLAVMFRAFKEAIRKRFITAEEIPDVLCRVLPESELIKRSVITLDGYTGFTPVQYRILELLMIHARQVIVTVCMDPAAGPYRRGRYQNLFYMGKEMVWKLSELAASRGVERDEDVLLGAPGSVMEEVGWAERSRGSAEAVERETSGKAERSGSRAEAVETETDCGAERSASCAKAVEWETSGKVERSRGRADIVETETDCRAERSGSRADAVETETACKAERSGSRAVAAEPDIAAGMETAAGPETAAGTDTTAGTESDAYQEKPGIQKECVRPLWRFRRSPSIAYIEKHLYRYDGAADWEPDEVEIWQAPGPGDEVAAVASRICALVREEGIRYRQIAVVTGDLAGYRHEIVSRFQMEGIPFFMDNKKSILENAMVEFIRAGLEAVRRDFDYESVFRYLKTGLVTDEEQELDRLENYCVALGIRGFKRWSETWEYTYRGAGGLNLDQLNAFRQEILRPMAALREAMRLEDRTVRTMNEAVLAWLEACGVEERLDRFREHFEKSGQFGLAKEYEQVYERVTELFGRLTELMGDEKLSLKEYMEVLDAGFEEIRVGVIPATVDRVVVGDLTRTRLDEIRVLFFIGVNEGVVPSGKDTGGLLTDMDREVLKDCRIQLAPTSKEDCFTQRYYLYLMLTKPSDRLILSYSLLDAGGKSRRPSGLVGELRRMFPRLAVREMEHTPREVMSRTEGKEMLIRGLREYAAGDIGKVQTGENTSRVQTGENTSGVQTGGNTSRVQAGGNAGGDLTEENAGRGRASENVCGKYYAAGKAQGANTEASAGGDHAPRQTAETYFLAVYRWFASNPDYADLVRRLTDAAFYSYEERGVGRAAARALYGQVMQGSVTRLEQYAACAYAHFLNYGLELAERQEYQIGAVDMGNLFHSSIDLYFKEMNARGLKAVQMSGEQQKELVRECVAAVAEEYGNTILTSSARNRYLTARIERMTERTIWALTEQLRKGDFEPAGYEVSFSAADDLKAMKIRLSEEEELHLRGRIDRLDLCEDGERVYVKIIDYKSGATQFDLAAVYYGLQLQLVVYLDAVMEMTQRGNPGKEIVPAGIFYYNIKDPLVEREIGQTAENVDEEILRQLRMNGLVNSDLEAVSHLDHQIRQKSDVIPVAMKDGLIREGQSSVASGRRFEILRQYVRRQLKKDGQEILSGRIGARPQKSGGQTACDYCPYHGVCGFDTRIAGYRFRRFAAVEAQQVWEEMEKECGAEGSPAGDGKE